MSRRSAGPAPKEGVIPDFPERTFDIKKQVVVIDLKGLIEVPYDSMKFGIKSMRAFVFDIGGVTHVEGEHGKYVVAGDYSIELSFSIVYFTPETKRAPEFLLSFVDHGMADHSSHGISVETLHLPLLQSARRYQNQSNMTSMSYVAGFSTIQVEVPSTVPSVTDCSCDCSCLANFSSCHTHTCHYVSYLLNYLHCTS
jgi:hypothetical protein